MNTCFRPALMVVICLMLASVTAAQKASEELPKPKLITIDKGLTKAQSDSEVRAALLYYAFWDTGREEYAKATLDDSFRDNTLPKGRPQGPSGPLAASHTFRQAVPDLRCSVEDLLVTGDKVTARLLFTGTDTGSFMNKPPTGRPVRFIAIDVLHVAHGKIIEDWHVEDNLTLMQQFGIVADQ